MSDQTQRFLLKWIVANVNTLPMLEKRQILDLIANDLGINNVIESSDGCRVIIDRIQTRTLDDILTIFGPHIKISQT